MARKPKQTEMFPDDTPEVTVSEVETLPPEPVMTEQTLGEIAAGQARLAEIAAELEARAAEETARNVAAAAKEDAETRAALAEFGA